MSFPTKTAHLSAILSFCVMAPWARASQEDQSNHHMVATVKPILDMFKLTIVALLSVSQCDGFRL